MQRVKIPNVVAAAQGRGASYTGTSTAIERLPLTEKLHCHKRYAGPKSGAGRERKEGMGEGCASGSAARAPHQRAGDVNPQGRDTLEPEAQASEGEGKRAPRLRTSSKAGHEERAAAKPLKTREVAQEGRL